MSSAAPSGSGPRPRRSASVSPSRSSITRKSMPSSRADVVNRADVRVVETRQRARLALEALAALGVGAGCGGRTLIATVRSSRVSRAR